MTSFHPMYIDVCIVRRRDERLSSKLLLCVYTVSLSRRLVS